MPDSEELWNLYWEVRLQELEDLGKREAILATSQLVRRLAVLPAQPVRLLELGCGEGKVISTLVEAHDQVHAIHTSLGVDYSHRSIEKCRRAYRGLAFLEGDFTDRSLTSKLSQFEIVLLVNALHEVFSAGYSAELQEVAVPAAKQRVEQAIAGAVECLVTGGYLVLFDGLETSGDIQELLTIRFLNPQARSQFDVFVREYHPFRISYRELNSPFLIELSRRDFTRYITKSIFLGKHLWNTERLESYQYYNEAEFRLALTRHRLTICELRTLTVNDEKWRNQVRIETPGVDFPPEHILIIAQKPV